MALSRVDYNAQQIENTREVLSHLLGDVAEKLGIVKANAEGSYDPTGVEFPEEL